MAGLGARWSHLRWIQLSLSYASALTQRKGAYGPITSLRTPLASYATAWRAPPKNPRRASRRRKPNAAALAVIGPLTTSAGDRFSGFHPNTTMFKSLRVFWVLENGQPGRASGGGSSQAREPVRRVCKKLQGLSNVHQLVGADLSEPRVVRGRVQN